VAYRAIRDQNGQKHAQPARGTHLGKNQAIDRKQALLMTTYNAAKFMGDEKMLGSIEKGKYADLVVFNGDYNGGGG
jgi:imidazolonepropionase-like amidohydrolase